MPLLQNALPLALALAVHASAAPQAYRFAGPTEPAGTFLRAQVRTNLHAFEAQADTLKAKAELDPEAPEAAAAWLDIPVAALTTGNLARDVHLRDLVLAGGTHPTLRYRSRGFAGPLAGDRQAGWRGTLRGVLELAGVRRPTPISVELRLRPDRRLEVRGQVTLDIRRFGLRPPDRVVVRVEPEVRLDFVVLLRPAGFSAGS